MMQLRNVIDAVCEESPAEEEENNVAEFTGTPEFDSQIPAREAKTLDNHIDLIEFAMRLASTLANKRDNPEIADGGATSMEPQDTSEADIEATPLRDALKK
jgi:hypothetical protein